MPLSGDKQANIIGAFNTTSRYLNYTVNINDIYFYNMVSQIHVYPLELQLNKANASDTEAWFLDLHLCHFSWYCFYPLKIYDKHDDLDFEIVNFLCLDCDWSSLSTHSIC